MLNAGSFPINEVSEIPETKTVPRFLLLLRRYQGDRQLQLLWVWRRPSFRPPFVIVYVDNQLGFYTYFSYIAWQEAWHDWREARRTYPRNLSDQECYLDSVGCGTTRGHADHGRPWFFGIDPLPSGA